MLEVKHNSKRRFFSIIAVFAVMLSIIAVICVRNIQPVELSRSDIDEIIAGARTDAANAVDAEIEDALNRIYAPVYAAIPEYENHYYSILGEYEGIVDAVLGDLADAAYDHLFDEFEYRFTEEIKKLDDQYKNKYETSLKKRVDEKIPNKWLKLGISNRTQSAIDIGLNHREIDVDSIIKKSKSEALQAISKKITGKLLIKISARIGGKTAARVASALAGFGAGFAACGPLAPFCGAGGAVAGWILSDVAVLKADEIFTRENFREELTLLIDEDKADKCELIREALKDEKSDLKTALDKLFNDV